MKILDTYKHKQEAKLDSLSVKLVENLLRTRERASKIILDRSKFDYVSDVDDFLRDQENNEQIEKNVKLRGFRNEREKQAEYLRIYNSVSSEIKDITEYDPFTPQANQIGLSGNYGLLDKKESFLHAIPKSKFKTFQLLFTPSQYRIVPKNKDEKGYENDLSECVVDPNLIPDSVITEILGMSIEGTSSEFEKIKFKDSNILRLKEFFQSSNLVPMGLETYDSTGKKIKKNNYSLYSIDGLGNIADGNILYCRSESTYSGLDERKIILRTDSAYKAFRQTQHIRDGQMLETTFNTSLLSEANHLHQMLLNISAEQDTTRKEREYSKFLVKIKPWIQKLKTARNYLKVQSFNKLLSTLGFIDVDKGKNPGAAAALMVVGKKFGGLRSDDLSGKSMQNNKNAECISKLIIESEGILGRFHEDFKNSLVDIYNLDDGQVDEFISLWHIGELLNIKELETLRVKPFSLYASKLIQKIQSLEDAINDGFIEDIKNEAAQVYLISKMFQFRKILEDHLFIIRFLDDNHVSVGNFMNVLLKIRGYITSNEIQQEEIIRNHPVLGHVYNNILGKIDEKIAELEQMKGNELHLIEKVRLKEDMVEFLQSFEIINLI